MRIAWNRKQHVFEDGIELKHCGRCDQWLILECFYKSKDTFDGLRGQCKECKKKEANSSKEYQKKYNHEYYENNKEHILETVHDYADKNKEKISARNKENREQNREQLSINSNNYYHANKEVIKIKSKEHRIKNKHILRIKKSIYYDKNREEIIRKNTEHVKKKRVENDPHFYLVRNLHMQKRRSLEKKRVTTLTVDEFKECLIFFDHKDAYTGLEMDNITRDHIIPMSGGGGYNKHNIIPCSLSVNSSKGNKDMEAWYKEQPFFSEERLSKIKQWMGYKPNSNILQTSFF